MFNFLKNIFGNKHEKDVKSYSAVVDKTNAYFNEYQAFSNDQLRSKTLEFRSRIKESLKDIDRDISLLVEKANGYGRFSNQRKPIQRGRWIEEGKE